MSVGKSLPLLVLVCGLLSAQSVEPPEPILKSAGQPEYSALARVAHIEGEVRLEFVLNRDGDPSSVTVLSGHPMLAPAAIETVKSWKFEYPPILLIFSVLNVPFGQKRCQSFRCAVSKAGRCAPCKWTTVDRIRPNDRAILIHQSHCSLYPKMLVVRAVNEHCSGQDCISGIFAVLSVGSNRFHNGAVGTTVLNQRTNQLRSNKPVPIGVVWKMKLIHVDSMNCSRALCSTQQSGCNEKCEQQYGFPHGMAASEQVLP